MKSLFALTGIFCLISSCSVPSCFKMETFVDTNQPEQKFRRENNIEPIPNGWHEFKGMWLHPEANKLRDKFRGYYSKETRIGDATSDYLPIGTIVENDVFRSGKMFSCKEDIDRDPKQLFPEGILLRYHIKDGKVLKREFWHMPCNHKNCNPTVISSFEEAKALAETWRKPPQNASPKS
jgi:hypothetical protein